MEQSFTNDYRVHREGDRFWFTFFCALCDRAFGPTCVQAEDMETALRTARVEAARHFNRCHVCGRWVCDEAYNEDEMMCVECAPRPRDSLCAGCGYPNERTRRFCAKCGLPLRQRV